MNILNLDINFQPMGKGVEYETFNFPGGEVHIKINTDKDIKQPFIITTRLNTSNDIMKLLIATDAIKRIGVKNIDLIIPYIPFARQDRVMVKGEPLSLKVFADIINAQNYDNVLVCDPHSDLSAALINNIEVVHQKEFVKRFIDYNYDFVMVAPDSGALKKIYDVAKHIGYKGEIICAEKVRDVRTGDIIRTIVNCGDLKGKYPLIIDDICDGGRTFIELAKVLKEKNCENISLFVTHGIFSKGIKVLLEHIHHIYTTDSIKNWDHDNLTLIKMG